MTINLFVKDGEYFDQLSDENDFDPWNYLEVLCVSDFPPAFISR
jgi:hypothetical protein